MTARATQELTAEHRVIEDVLAALDRAVADAARTRAVPAAFLRDVVTFSRLFVDRCHHGKEERCFFPCLAKCGVPVEGGPIGVMLREHEEGRRLVGVIDDTLARAEDGRATLEDVLAACRDYVDLLRAHIAKETEILFPIGDAVADAEDDAGVRRCFAETDAAFGDGARDVLAQLAETLAHPGGTP